jgi:hypothetical protein
MGRSDDTEPKGVLVDAEVLAASLAIPLSELELPTRLKNWAKRQGVETLRELAGTSPELLMSQPNVGRTTVRKARRIIEERTGVQWEALLHRISDVAIISPLAPEAPPFSTLKTWDALRAAMPEWLRSIRLEHMPLSARMRAFVEREGLVTLGQLASISHAELVKAPNLGRRSVAELVPCIHTYVAGLEHVPALMSEGLLACFKELVRGLDPTMRMIAILRSGLGGESATLAEVGELVGVSRERIRQLELVIGERLRRQPCSLAVRERIEDAVAEGPVPLEELGTDPWWEAASQLPSVVEFVVGTVLRLPIRVFELGERSWLSPHALDEILAVRKTLLSDVAQVEMPVELSVLRSLADARAAPFGRHVAHYLFEEVVARVNLDSSGGVERALSFGDSVSASLLAILRASPEPMHVDEVHKRLGKRVGNLPDEVMYFRRGYIGLVQHFPDFDRWRERLVPAAERLILELGPERQWHCGEVLEELRETNDIPDWITPFGLGALLKTSQVLRYLGRLRVACVGAVDNDRRVYVHDAVTQILEEAGGPLPRTVLLDRLRERLGMAENGVHVLLRPMFVRVDAVRIGLLSRDVPGGDAAIALAAEHMERILEHRGYGMSQVHACREVSSLSASHAQWSPELTLSVLRADGRFRSSRSGALGLASWESTRVPTRLELVRQALDAHDQRVSVEEVLSVIESVHGERPSRATLAGLAFSLGASLSGEWLVRRGA